MAFDEPELDASVGCRCFGFFKKKMVLFSAVHLVNVAFVLRGEGRLVESRVGHVHLAPPLQDSRVVRAQRLAHLALYARHLLPVRAPVRGYGHRQEGAAFLAAVLDEVRGVRLTDLGFGPRLRAAELVKISSCEASEVVKAWRFGKKTRVESTIKAYGGKRSICFARLGVNRSLLERYKRTVFSLGGGSPSGNVQFHLSQTSVL